MSLRRKIREQAKRVQVFRDSNGDYWMNQEDFPKLAHNLRPDSSVKTSIISKDVVCDLLDKATERILFRLRTYVKKVPVDMAISLVEQELGAEAEWQEHGDD